VLWEFESYASSAAGKGEFSSRPLVESKTRAICGVLIGNLVVQNLGNPNESELSAFASVLVLERLFHLLMVECSWSQGRTASQENR
jgi:hypothetical protein